MVSLRSLQQDYSAPRLIEAVCFADILCIVCVCVSMCLCVCLLKHSMASCDSHHMKSPLFAISGLALSGPANQYQDPSLPIGSTGSDKNVIWTLIIKTEKI